MKKIFIFGYYGFKNIGDEAILASIIEMIKSCEPSAQIYVLSYNVKYTEKTHRVIGVSRNSMGNVIKAIKNADLVISGGGSLLQDVTSSRSLYYYLSLITTASMLKKPILFYSNGFGPVRRKINQYITGKIINRVEQIILRDEASKIAMMKVGVTHPIEVTADATFQLNSANKHRIMEIFEQEEIPMDRPLVGVSVRPWKVREGFVESMAQFADYIASKGLSVVFIPMQPAKDIEISKVIIENMKREAYLLKQEYTPKEVLGIIGAMDVLVGMRLHALIFAAIKGVPMLGLEYDPKISSFLTEMKQINGGKVEALDKLNLCVEFDRLWDGRSERSEELQCLADHTKEKLHKNKTILREMLKKRRC